MSSGDADGFVGFIFGFIIGGLIALCAMGNYKDFTWRHDAVKHGYAKWTVNEWGKAEFQWIEKEEQP